MRDRFPFLNGLRLLVVDDDLDTRELLTILFAEDGAEVIAVDCVDEALAAVEQLNPDILISDIKLIGEDGYTLIQKIRGFDAKRVREIPAIALTGQAREEDRIQALSRGFHRHVTKPIDLDEFLAVVNNLARQLIQPAIS